MSDMHVIADRLTVAGDSFERVQEHPPLAREGRYPLRLRLWIIAGSAAAAWVVACVGGLALLHAFGVR